MKSDALHRAAKRVREAVREEGVSPGYHRAVMEKHRLEWPTLWREIDALLAELDRMDRSSGPEK